MKTNDQNPAEVLRNIFGTRPHALPASESEEVLFDFTKSMFLKTWGFPNPFYGKGAFNSENSTYQTSKEHCDYMVSFGRDVILFSDKHVLFEKDSNPPTTPQAIQLAWDRWKRKAVTSSITQLHSGLKRHRLKRDIFVDQSQKLKIQLPSFNETAYHLVATCRAQELTVTAPTSFRLRVTPPGVQSNIGDMEIPLIDGRPVHVFDDLALECIAKAFDTTRDFVDYLAKRQDILATFESPVLEEELAIKYLTDVLKPVDRAGQPLVRDPQLTVADYLMRLVDARTQQYPSSYIIDSIIDGFYEHHAIHTPNPSSSTQWNAIEQAGNAALRRLAELNRKDRQFFAEKIFEKLSPEGCGPSGGITTYPVNALSTEKLGIFVLPSAHANSEGLDLNKYVSHTLCISLLETFQGANPPSAITFLCYQHEAKPEKPPAILLGLTREFVLEYNKNILSIQQQKNAMTSIQ